MSHKAMEYDRQATEYEERAKRVTDPWIRDKYLTLAKHCREVRRVPKGHAQGAQGSGGALAVANANSKP
jgi:hypothetical protein